MDLKIQLGVKIANYNRSPFLPKVVEMCWNSTKWWGFFAEIVVWVTSHPIVGGFILAFLEL